MEYVMYVAIVAAVAIIIMLAVAMVTVIKAFRTFRMQDDIIELQQQQYRALELEHKRDLATAEFLYETLLDLTTPINDTTILYKARSIQVILMIIDYQGYRKECNVDYLRDVLNMPTAGHIDSAVKEIFSDHEGYNVMDDRGTTAYERFMNLIAQIEQDECDVSGDLVDARREVSNMINKPMDVHETAVIIGERAEDLMVTAEKAMVTCTTAAESGCEVP